MIKEMSIKNVAVSLPKKMERKGQSMTTGIQKQKVESVYLGKNGFQHDDVGDKKNHGGPDRAVCMYPYEHYPFWEKEFGVTFPAAAFGENITAENMTEEEVYIGSTYQLGEAVIQVTQGRIPCETINRRMNLSNLLARIVETGYSGYLCRVLKEGEVKSTDTIQLIEPDPNQVTVMYAIQTYFHHPKDKEAIENILAVDALAENWRKKLRKRLEH